jgi:hypothetical protein
MLWHADYLERAHGEPHTLHAFMKAWQGFMKPRAGKYRLSGFRNNLHFADDIPTNIATCVHMDAPDCVTIISMRKTVENRRRSVNGHFLDG